MTSVKCVAPVAMGVPALGRVVKPGEEVEVSDEIAAGLLADRGLWEATGALPPTGGQQGPQQGAQQGDQQGPPQGGQQGPPQGGQQGAQEGPQQGSTPDGGDDKKGKK